MWLRIPCTLPDDGSAIEGRIGTPHQSFIRSQAGQEGRTHEFVERAYRSGSYDEVLQLCLEYVQVT